MKRFRKILRAIRDIIAILGIPAIGALGWDMHQEQMNLKKEQIKLKEEQLNVKNAQIEAMKLFQSDIILEKYNLEQEFFEGYISELRDSISAQNRDSLFYNGKMTQALNDSVAGHENKRLVDFVSGALMYHIITTALKNKQEPNAEGSKDD